MTVAMMTNVNLESSHLLAYYYLKLDAEFKSVFCLLEKSPISIFLPTRGQYVVPSCWVDWHMAG